MNTGNSNQEYRHAHGSGYAKSESKDMLYYYSILLNNWWWVLLGLIAGATMCYIQLRYSKTTYRVSGSVLIEDVEQKSVSKEVMLQLGGLNKDDDLIEDRIRMFSSTELMNRIVDSLNLNVTYAQKGKVKTSELYDNSPLQLLYWNTEGAEKNFQLLVSHYDEQRFQLHMPDGKVELKNYGVPFRYGKRELVLKKIGLMSDQSPIIIEVQDEYSTAGRLAQKLDIEQMGRSHILNISMVDEIPDRAVAIINRLVREYGLMRAESKNDAGRRTMNFIEQRLNFVANELYSVEKEEEGFKKDRGLPLVTSDVAKNILDKSNAVELKIVGLDERADFIRTIENTITNPSPTNQYSPLPYSTEVLGSTPLIALISQYNALINRRSQMMESAKEGNPILNSSDEELKNLKNNILISIQAIKQEVNTQKERYRQQMVPLESQLNMMPTNERELTKIMREKSIKETLFLFLLQKREETALNVAAQVPNARMLERATLKGKVSPKPIQIGIFWIFLGIALPMFVLYLRDLVKDKVLYRSDIDKYLSLPFVGFIPHSRDKQGRMVINNSRSVLSESFRLVRSNLQNTAPPDKSRTILVTSTISGEGKSFVSVNLATTFALTGKKVVLLGLDLRKPKMAQYLTGEKPSEKGIAQFIAGEGRPADFIRPWEKLPNLHYIDCGTIPKNPAELMMTDRLKDLFDYCERYYDFIIVDATPIGVVADTFLLKDFVSQTLVVVRYNYSRVAHLKFMDEMAIGKKLPNMNILLNDVRQERGNSYNYGYYSSSYYQAETNGIFGKIKKAIGLKA